MLKGQNNMAEPEKKDKKDKEKPKPEEGKEQKEPKEKEKVEREKLRLVGTDLDGHRTVLLALTDIKGIGSRTAHAITEVAKVPKSEKIGNLSEEKLEELEEVIKAINEMVPSWIVNRQRDWDTGSDRHLVGVDVDLNKKDDINRLKMIRCYRGIRHETGQRVRGQRTRSNARSGLTVGVAKKAAKAQLAEKAKKEKGRKGEK